MFSEKGEKQFKNVLLCVFCIAPDVLCEDTPEDEEEDKRPLREGSTQGRGQSTRILNWIRTPLVLTGDSEYY